MAKDVAVIAVGMFLPLDTSQTKQDAVHRVLSRTYRGLVALAKTVQPTMTLTSENSSAHESERALDGRDIHVIFRMPTTPMPPELEVKVTLLVAKMFTKLGQTYYAPKREWTRGECFGVEWGVQVIL